MPILTEQRIVVIGASAGGIDALLKLMEGLPAGFPAPICIVLHIPADSPSLLAGILGRHAQLRVKEAVDREPYEGGNVYVAPPDRHILIDEDGTLHVGRGPRENRHRPAVDPLFRSAALSHGRRAIGVILSGTLDDGTAGLMVLKQRGGIAIVQDPADALYPGMPQSALARVEADYTLPVKAIAQKLVTIVESPLPPRAMRPLRFDNLTLEVKMAELDRDALATDDRPGRPSPYSCPDCQGVLWQIDEEGEFSRFRCRVGHAFSPETMLGAQSERLEEALWAAMKTLEESARLAKRLSETERTRGHDWLADRFEKKEQDARSRVEVIRRFLISDSSEVPVQSPDRSQSG